MQRDPPDVRFQRPDGAFAIRFSFWRAKSHERAKKGELIAVRYLDLRYRFNRA